MTPLRLSDLEPRFIALVTDDGSRRKYVDDIASAHGVMFVCPKCFERAGRVRPGVHGMLCWRPRVDPSIEPGPGRWEMSGTSFDDLTLTAGSSSVLVTGGCRAHFFVTNGAIAWAEPWEG